MMKILQTLLMVLVLLSTTLVLADPPKLINYQGKLTDANGEPITNTTVRVAFRIYDAATGGTLVWGVQTFDNVPVVQGHFNVILGGGQPIEPSDLAGDRFLGIIIDGGTEITPRQQLLSAPYALVAGAADTASVAETVQGNNLFVKNTGDVGIGTTSPGTKLEVNFIVPDVDKGQGILLKNTGEGAASVIIKTESLSTTNRPQSAVSFRYLSPEGDRVWIMGVGGGSTGDFKISKDLTDIHNGSNPASLILRDSGELWTRNMDDRVGSATTVNILEDAAAFCPAREYVCGVYGEVDAGSTGSKMNPTKLKCCKF